MEEQDIESKLPDVFLSISRIAQDTPMDWKKVYEDLESLNWLKSDDGTSTEEISNGAWQVTDRWGLSLLEDEPRFKVTRINKVKLFITESIYNLANNKDRMSQLCFSTCKVVSDLFFFKKAKNLILAADDDDLATIFLKIHSVYQDFVKTAKLLFMHLDKYLASDTRRSLDSILHEQFFKSVIEPVKEKLKMEDSCKKIAEEFDRDYTPIPPPPIVTPKISQDSYNSVPSQTNGSANSNGDQYSRRYPTFTTDPYISSNNYYSNPYQSSYSSYSHENVYYGEIDSEGKRSGYGKIKYSNGDTYEGNWENDKRSGKGIYKWKDWGVYEGDFEDGVIKGVGKRTYSSGNIYIGEFKNGKKDGSGEMKFKNGDKYEGEWVDDEMHGDGKYTWKTGDSFVGKFKRDKREGKGTLTLACGDTIEGIWVDGELEQKAVA